MLIEDLEMKYEAGEITSVGEEIFFLLRKSNQEDKDNERRKLHLRVKFRLINR